MSVWLSNPYKSILSSPYLHTICLGCCYFFSLQGSLLLSELYQFIYVFRLMEGKLVLTHTLYSDGTRGQKSGDLGWGDPEEWMYIERSGTFGYLYFRDMDGGVWHDWSLRGRISDKGDSLKTSVFQMFQDCLNSVRLYFFFFAPKSLQMVIAAMKLKDAYSLEGRLWPT